MRRLSESDKYSGDATHANSPATSLGQTRHALIFHYHLFKNAGTSVDEMLRRNFGTNWVAHEFPGPRHENRAAVHKFVSANPHLQAISSHTAFLPVPQIEGMEIFPVIFIRHPIDRLRSAYEFERRQNANTAGARLAKTRDFAGYLRELLENPRHRQIRNFQTLRLSHNEPTRTGSEVQRAILALQKLPFVGLVERFEEAINELQKRLRPFFPHFRAQTVHKNATHARQRVLEVRLAEVKTAMGNDLFEKICAANADDLAIYEFVSDRFGRRTVDLLY
jgi:hypothetical protein